MEISAVDRSHTTWRLSEGARFYLCTRSSTKRLLAQHCRHQRHLFFRGFYQSSQCLRRSLLPNGQKPLRILRHTLNPHFKVEMWTCRTSRGPNFSDLLTALDQVALFD